MLNVIFYVKYLSLLREGCGMVWHCCVCWKCFRQNNIKTVSFQKEIGNQNLNSNLALQMKQFSDTMKHHGWSRILFGFIFSPLDILTVHFRKRDKKDIKTRVCLNSNPRLADELGAGCRDCNIHRGPYEATVNTVSTLCFVSESDNTHTHKKKS